MATRLKTNPVTGKPDLTAIASPGLEMRTRWLPQYGTAVQVPF